jgi:hypothetical protein
MGPWKGRVSMLNWKAESIVVVWKQLQSAMLCWFVEMELWRWRRRKDQDPFAAKLDPSVDDELES